GYLPAPGGQRGSAVRSRSRLPRGGDGLPASTTEAAAPCGRGREVERTGLMPAPTRVGELAPRRIGARHFDFAHQVAVMAIINRTPDSFYDHGRTFELQAAVDSALAAVAAGADWVDIGGMAFSPDRKSVV